MTAVNEQVSAGAPDRADLGENAALKETLEDYTLRFAPRSYRKWGTGVVATSALGGIAYLADFSIGANIGISYGTGNALLASPCLPSSSWRPASHSPTMPRDTISTSI